MSEQQKRPWQFSIRDVLLIMLIVGLGVGWFVDHRRLSDELSRQQQQYPWVWLNTATPFQGSTFNANGLSLVDVGLVNTVPGATNPPQPDPAITDPPPETPMP